MDMHDPEYLGRVAYEATVRGVGGISLPTWGELPEELRDRWNATGRETVAHVRELSEEAEAAGLKMDQAHADE